MHVGEPVEVTYNRVGQQYTTLLTPKYDEESGRYLYGFISAGGREKLGFFENIKYAFCELGYYIDEIGKSTRLNSSHAT